ncbi:MAG: 3-deoxy-D-manno-octulosonate 8-phosphate phosphatase (KDO 8-P phosphatase) [Francisellaceae bacterium]|jgi:3-deoxy-D-manno-octulosonate 8-phosphate phosphatase (KDO 8-P phosphatase)
MYSSKLKKVKLLILDVDGVLTDGKIILSNNGDELKSFNVKDGLGIKLLQKLGIEVAIITGKTSNLVQRRFESLGVKYIYQGQSNKIKAYQSLLARLNFIDNQVAYIGDDLPDLPLLTLVGFSITVNDGHYLIKNKVDFCTSQNGGDGAVREVCDMIYKVHGLEKKLVEDFISLGEAT